MCWKILSLVLLEAARLACEREKLVQELLAVGQE